MPSVSASIGLATVLPLPSLTVTVAWLTELANIEPEIVTAVGVVVGVVVVGVVSALLHATSVAIDADITVNGKVISEEHVHFEQLPEHLINWITVK